MKKHLRDKKHMIARKIVLVSRMEKRAAKCAKTIKRYQRLAGKIVNFVIDLSRTYDTILESVARLRGPPKDLLEVSIDATGPIKPEIT